MDLEGKIIEYLDGDTVKLAFVDKVQGKKLQIIDENGKQLKLALKQVLVRHDRQIDQNSFRSSVTQLKADITAVADELDIELLWEEVVDTGKTYDPSALAELYFGSSTGLQISAVCHTLLTDSNRFRFKNNQFTPRTAEEMEREIAVEKKRKQREEREQQVRKWVRKAMNADSIIEIPAHLEEFVQQIEAFLLKHHTNEAVDLLEKLGYDDTTEEVAFEILVKTGEVSPGSDAILKVAGLQRHFDDRIQKHAETVQAYTNFDGREDFTSVPTFSIDDEDTTEIDDAISVEIKDDRIVVGIHIADLSCFVDREDPVDEEALRRCATVYMPTGAVHMIPDEISCDLASLNEGATRPSFCTVIEFNRSGGILDTRICRAVVKVQRRLNYEESDELIANGTCEYSERLRILEEICNVGTDKRLDEGAMIFSKTELKVRVKGDEITMTPQQTVTPSRNIISELMILCNSTTADFAKLHDIPIIYRAQVEPDDPAKRYMGRIVKDTNPNVFRGLKRGRLSLHPQPHCGLGLQAYTQVTSPLRRFGDLVMQRQIAAFLNKEEYPYTSSNLLEVIGNAETVERENRAIERRCTRYWELEHLRREGLDREYEGVIMSKLPGAYMVALKPWPIRGRMPAKDSLKFGSTIKVRISDLNPALSVIKLEQVL